jgi:hypothetical protein
MLRMVWEKIVINYCPGMERLRRTMKALVRIASYPVKI